MRRIAPAASASNRGDTLLKLANRRLWTTKYSFGSKSICNKDENDDDLHEDVQRVQADDAGRQNTVVGEGLKNDGGHRGGTASQRDRADDDETSGQRVLPVAPNVQKQIQSDQHEGRDDRQRELAPHADKGRGGSMSFFCVRVGGQCRHPRFRGVSRRAVVKSAPAAAAA